MGSLGDGAIGLCRMASVGVLVIASASCATNLSRSAANSSAPAAESSTAARAERIFRYQSRLADALLDRYPLQENLADADPALVAADTRMTESCGALTRAVVEDLEGRAASLDLKFEVMNSLDDCEQAAQAMEGMLKALEQSLAATAPP